MTTFVSRQWLHRTKARVVTFGRSGGDCSFEYPGRRAWGLRLSVSHASDHFDIVTRLTGSHSSLAATAAF